MTPLVFKKSGLPDELWVLVRLGKAPRGWVHLRRFNTVGPARRALEEAGYVEAFPAPDGRGMACRLTARGQAYLLRRQGS